MKSNQLTDKQTKTIQNYLPAFDYTQENQNPIKIRKSYLIMLLIYLLLGQAQANVTASTPKSRENVTVSHPEVWGYDLNNYKLLSKGYEVTGLTYRAPGPDGDTVFRISRCVENCNQPGKEKYEEAMLWFFAGKVDFTDDPRAYCHKNQLNYSYSNDRADLLNGECVKIFHHSTGKLCQKNPLAEYLFLKGNCTVLDDEKNVNEYDIATNSNPEIKRYSIIGAADKIYRYIDQPDGLCDRGGPAGGEVIYKQLYTMLSLIGLEDGTFIASRGDFIIRFDRDFKTKFKPKQDVELATEKIIKGNFFVLPYEKIEELRGRVALSNDHGVQGLHDELLLYLYRREENK